MEGDARLRPLRLDSLACISRVIAVAVDVDADPGLPGDVDGLGRSLLRAQPAGEDGPVRFGRRPADEPGRHEGGEDRIDRDDPAPGVRLEGRYARNRRWRLFPNRVTKRGGHSRVGG